MRRQRHAPAALAVAKACPTPAGQSWTKNNSTSSNENKNRKKYYNRIIDESKEFIKVGPLGNRDVLCRRNSFGHKLMVVFSRYLAWLRELQRY